jgi:hypothetical protein
MTRIITVQWMTVAMPAARLKARLTKAVAARKTGE